MNKIGSVELKKAIRNPIKLSLTLIFLFVAFSCIDDAGELGKKKEVVKAIVQFHKEDFSQEGRVIDSAEVVRIREELRQLEGFTFSIRTRPYFGKNALETDGKGRRVKIGDFDAKNAAQQFYLDFPLEAESFRIYSVKEGVPIGIGHFADEDKQVVYTQNKDPKGDVGFEWGLEAEGKSCFIENQDVYPYAIMAFDGEFITAKNNHLHGQELNIVPNDHFVIDTLIMENPRLVKSEEFILEYSTINSASQPVQMLMKIDEKLSMWSEFEDNSCLSIVPLDTLEVEVDLAVQSMLSPDLEEEYELISRDGQQVDFQRPTYITRRIYDDQGWVSTLPNSKAVILYMAVKHFIESEYEVIMRGVNTGKSLKFRGKWSGIDYTGSRFVINEYSLETDEFLGQRIYYTGN